MKTYINLYNNWRFLSATICDVVKFNFRHSICSELNIAFVPNETNIKKYLFQQKYYYNIYPWRNKQNKIVVPKGKHMIALSNGINIMRNKYYYTFIFRPWKGIMISS